MMFFGPIEYDRLPKMANIANILHILVILCIKRDKKNHFGCDIFGSFTFKRHTFMLWHTSDVHKHHHFSLQASISVPYEKTYN